MSEMVGSCQQRLERPQPKDFVEDLIADLLLFSELSSVGSASINWMTAWRTSPRTRWLSMRGQRFEVDLVHQLAVKRELQFLIFRLQAGLLAGRRS